MPNSQTTLNEELFSQSVRLLTGRDEHLAEVVKAYGQPPLWVREPGFPTLVYIILEQQVSLASARAAFERLKAAVRPLTPKGFLRLNDAELLRIGFSRQKTLYTRLLAESLARRHFNLRYLHGLPDDSAHKMLMAFKEAVEIAQVKVSAGERFGKQAGVKSFLPAEADAQQLGVIQPQEPLGSQGPHRGFEALKSRSCRSQRDLLLQDDVNERGEARFAHPQRRLTVGFHHFRQVFIAACQ